MVKVDPLILQALGKAIARYGSVFALSKELGISHSTILFWMSGKIHHISTDIWQNKLYHYIEQDLAEVCPNLTALEIRDKYYFHSVMYKPVRVPLVSEDDLVQYEMPMEDIASFISRHSRRKFFLETDPALQCFAAFLFKNMRKYGIPWHTLVVFTKHTCFTDKMTAIVKFQDDFSLHICKVSISPSHSISFSDYLSKAEEESNLISRKIDWAFPISEIRYLCRDTESNIKL